MLKIFITHSAILAGLVSLSFTSTAQICPAPTPLVPDGDFSAAMNSNPSPWVLNARGNASTGVLAYRVDFSALQLGWRQPRVVAEGESDFLPPYVLLTSLLRKGTDYYTECFVDWNSDYNNSFIHYDRLGLIVTNGYPNTVAVGLIGTAAGEHSFYTSPNTYCPGGGCGYSLKRVGGIFRANGGEDRINLALFAGGIAEKITPGMTWGIFAFDNVGIWPIPVASSEKVIDACTNESIQLGVLCASMPSGTTYSWSSDYDENPTVFSTTTSHLTVRSDASATYTLNVRLPNGEKYSSSVLVNRDPRCIGFRVNNYKENISQINAHVYPVPADKEANVRVEKATKATLHNALGAIVMQINLQIGENKINTFPLPNGVYYLRYDENEKTVSKCVIVRH